MRKIFLLLTITITLLTNLAIVDFAIAQQKNNNYSVNFKNIPMKDFIIFVSEFTGKNIIYNENDIRGNVTVTSQKDMDTKEILDIFESVMKLNGYLPVYKGKNNIQIIAEKDMMNYNDDIVLGKKTNSTYLTTVITLKNYNATTMLPVLNRIKSRTAFVEAIKGLNIIVIRDEVDRIDKMTKLINRIDNSAALYKFHTIPLEYSIASKVEQQINKFFNELSKSSINPTSPVVVSDDISNTLIIAATDYDFSRISQIISSMDSKSSSVNTEPRVFYLKNAKAGDVEKVLTKLINSLSQTAGKTETKKPSISSDNATNSILAVGSKELYDNIESLIDKLDVSRKQVYVEALILETTVNRTNDFGVEWFGGSPALGNGAIVGGSNVQNLKNIIKGINSNGDTASILGGIGGGLSLGVIGNAITYNGVKFPSIGALISALNSTAGVNIISNPQILTLDNSEARVFVGENKAFKTSNKLDSKGDPIDNYDYRDVGIELKVTPQISNNDMITLQIKQKIDKASPEKNSSDNTLITYKRETETTVKLKNHSIMVISGLIKDDTDVTRSGIPLLSDIPILGWLFKRETKIMSKTNVMLFITAHIIDTIDEEQAKKILEEKRKTMIEFNKYGDSFFKRGDFTDSGRNIKLKNDIEGVTEEEAKLSTAEREKIRKKEEKEAKKAAKKREKERIKAEKEAAKAAKKREKELKLLEEKANKNNENIISPSTN